MGPFFAAGEEERPILLAFGDSLTAGFGVSEDQSYPSLLQEILRDKGYPHQVVNAGVSGETTAGGLRRIQWVLRQDPEIVIVELGANDGLRGLSLKEMQKNLAGILDACLEQGARVLLAGMKLPPNYGPEYTREFEAVYHRLAEQYEVAFMPFFLEDVAAKKDLTQPDGVHPKPAGYPIVARNVFERLKPLLEKKAG